MGHTLFASLLFFLFISFLTYLTYFYFIFYFIFLHIIMNYDEYKKKDYIPMTVKGDEKKMKDRSIFGMKKFSTRKADKIAKNESFLRLFIMFLVWSVCVVAIFYSISNMMETRDTKERIRDEYECLKHIKESETVCNNNNKTK